MKILEYKQWRRFENVIDKAKQACENSGISVFEHFANVSKLSKRANNAEVEIKDYKLTRYACYLIAQNGDTRKKVISLAQTADDIAKRKGLRYREDILDNMGSEELAANLFRITQTESRLKRELLKRV